MLYGTNGDPYKQIVRAAWYKKLTPVDQAIAAKLHSDPSVDIAYADILNEIAKEKAKMLAPATSAPATTNYFERIGYGSGHFDEDDVSSSDDEDATPKEANKHFRKKILKKLNKAKKRKLDELEDSDYESSDSEDEAGTDPARQERRRQIKAAELAAIANEFFPLTEQTALDFREKLESERLADNKARAGRRQMYRQETREMFAQVGEQMKHTNLEHNSYLRRAHRDAVPAKKLKTGGSDNYDSTQGKIRSSLLKVIAADHKKMAWTKTDFPNKKTWKAVKTLFTEEMSNASTGDTYYERVEAGDDPTGSSHRVAFHHVAWKEAEGGIFSEFALLPHNLTALSDHRELLNKGKIKKIKNAGGKLPPVGSHDAFGHQGTGFRSDQKKVFERAQGGGQFKDIDMEAVYYTLKPQLEPRTPKADLYNK